MSRRAPVTETDVTSALIRASSDQTPRPAGHDRAVVPRRAAPSVPYISLDAPRLAAARRGWSTMQTRADSRSVEKVKLFCSNACATSAKGAWQVRRVATNTDERAVVACCTLAQRAPLSQHGAAGAARCRVRLRDRFQDLRGERGAEPDRIRPAHRYVGGRGSAGGEAI